MADKVVICYYANGLVRMPFFPIRNCLTKKKPLINGNKRVRTNAPYTEVPTVDMRLVVVDRAGQSDNTNKQSLLHICNRLQKK